MGAPVDISSLSDAQLAEEFLNRNLLSAGQLKAALDYQASVGGKISDLVVKLGLAKEEVLEYFLARLSDGEDFVLDEEEKSGVKKRVRIPEFDVASLRVHKKLLDKAPPELVERCGILVFFPPGGSRAIMLSANPPLSEQGVKKLQELLCVELVAIGLTEPEREKLRAGETPESRLLGGPHGLALPEGGAASEKASAAPASTGKKKKKKKAKKAAKQAEKVVEKRDLTGELEELAALEPAESENSSASSTPEPADVTPTAAAPEPEASAEGVDKHTESRPVLRPFDSTREIAEDSELLVQALIRLLMKKNVITQDELVIEAKLAARQRVEQVPADNCEPTL